MTLTGADNECKCSSLRVAWPSIPLVRPTHLSQLPTLTLLTRLHPLILAITEVAWLSTKTSGGSL